MLETDRNKILTVVYETMPSVHRCLNETLARMKQFSDYQDQSNGNTRQQKKEEICYYYCNKIQRKKNVLEHEQK